MASKKTRGIPPDRQSATTRRGGKPPSELQRSLGWYRDEDFDLTPWWEDSNEKGTFRKESELYQKFEMDHQLRLEGKGSDHTETDDLSAAFLWEALRRHPDHSNLRQLHERICEDFELGSFCGSDDLRRQTVHDAINLEYGHGVSQAVEELACFGRFSYPALGEKDPRQWLGGYRALWKIIGKTGQLPAAIPPRYRGSSNRETQGVACTHLVRNRAENSSFRLDEVLQPTAWGYERIAIRGVPLESFAEAEDQSSVLFEPPELPEVRLVKIGEDQDFYDLSGTPAAERRPHVDLRIHYHLLKSLLVHQEMEPLVLGVNLDAPTDLLVKEFRSIITGLKRGRPSPRKIRWESFRALSELDREVRDGESGSVIPSSIAKAFDAATQIDASGFIEWCDLRLKARKRS